jgi:predicted secreted protein
MRLQAHTALKLKTARMCGFFTLLRALIAKNKLVDQSKSESLFDVCKKAASDCGFFIGCNFCRVLLRLTCRCERTINSGDSRICAWQTSIHKNRPGAFSEITMNLLKKLLLSLGLITAATFSFAQAVQTSGTLVVVPASGEVKQANDEARLTFSVEEQDKDKSVAASRVNQKMKQGMDIVRREDPQAVLTTRGYYTYAVYPEDQPRTTSTKPRQPIGWRVGQSLEVKTTNLNGLPKTVAAAQRVLGLNGINFGLTEATERKLDAQRIDVTYKNLTERIASIAKAMGRNPADAVLDTIDFEGSGNYVPQNAAAPKMMRAMAADAAPVEEPSFEPGETTLSMQVVGKVRFR